MLQTLAQTLFNTYRRRILGLLLLHPDRAYYVREIARETKTHAGTLHKELKKLDKAGILTSERRGNQLTYQANRMCPIFDELASILRKTSGLAAVVEDALKPLAPRVKIAFVFGSMAQARETSSSDVDVMLIGEVSFSEVVKLLYPAQTSLHREINPKVFSVEEWKAKLEKEDPFVHDVLSKPKMYLIGNNHDLEKLTGN